MSGFRGAALCVSCGAPRFVCRCSACQRCGEGPSVCACPKHFPKNPKPNVESLTRCAFCLITRREAAQARTPLSVRTIRPHADLTVPHDARYDASGNVARPGSRIVAITDATVRREVLACTICRALKGHLVA